MDKKPTIAELTREGVRKVSIGNEDYYVVEDIRHKFPHVRFDTERLADTTYGKAVQVKDVHPMSEWDKKIQQSLNFNPKKR
jgi:hypothetical protein